MKVTLIIRNYIQQKLAVQCEQNRSQKEPCGTPYTSELGADTMSSTISGWLQSWTQDANHSRTMLQTLKVTVNLFSRMEWSSMLNEVLKSNKTETQANPSVTDSQGHSTQQSWHISKRLLSDKRFWSCLKTTFSRIFQTNSRLDTGLKCFKLFASSLDFFKSGITTTCLKCLGIVLVAKEALKIAVTNGTRSSRLVLGRKLGLGPTCSSWLVTEQSAHEWRSQ